MTQWQQYQRFQERSKLVFSKGSDPNMVAKITSNILHALDEAKNKHPVFPQDILHRMSILQEEVGEATQAANDHVLSGESIEPLRKELLQAGAMIYRILENIGV